MARTKLPLTTWFLAIYLISQAKSGPSALDLMRQLGVRLPTFWLLHQKINRAMATQNAPHQPSGTVELDDAYLGGELTSGKLGRSSEDKTPFVAAVSPMIMGIRCTSSSMWSGVHFGSDQQMGQGQSAARHKCAQRWVGLLQFGDLDWLPSPSDGDQQPQAA